MLKSLWLILLLISTSFTGAVEPSTSDPTSDSVESPREAELVQDNSFLIEEAYNQEPGVVQHLLNVQRSVQRLAGADEREWSLVFTQEWPVFSQTHQFSYSIPYRFLNTDGQSADGIEDVLLNYRLQALTETDSRPAFTPRLSLILPTGDAAEGFGSDTLGGQVNLAASKVVGRRWTVHANAGTTVLPDVEGHDLASYNVGGSAIYAATRNLNLMLELTANWDELVSETGRKEREFAAIISPGVRYAFNHANDAQTVIGLGLPIGLSSGAPDYGVIIYLSYEHFFLRSQRKPLSK